MRVAVWLIAAAWYPIAGAIASKSAMRERACFSGFLGYDCARKTANTRKRTMPGRLETWRIQAYNTAKQSENKMHDDTVAKRFGFSGGLVPGVDVMAYMMHMPVARWGRAFLEHGLIDARFIKPVYDGEMTDVTAEESNGVLTIEVRSRSDLCATGSASLPAQAPSFSIADY